jgi:hypothetical protein
MTPGPHGPLIPWATLIIQSPNTERRNTARWSKSFKSRRQFGLKSATRLHEAGFASNRRSAILR